jgi:hypothetical protein
MRRNSRKALKRCSCGTTWHTLDCLLNDAKIELLGFQESFSNESEGLYLFNHTDCGNTIALPETSIRLGHLIH